MTPNIAVVQFANPYWHSFRLWLPLFLLWIPVILLAPFVLPIVLVVCIVTQVSFLETLRTGWAILSGLRGTEVSFNVHANHVYVRIL